MKNRDFTHVITNENVSVGYLSGSSKVLFIKTGQGGTIYGDGNKYLDLANRINEKYGCSVFVSATISDSREAYERDMQLLEQCSGTTEYEIYYLGVSKGGLIGLWQAADNPKIKKMLTINAPLMINYHGKHYRELRSWGEIILL